MEEVLWFDRFIWLVFLTPFLGLLVAAISKRQDPVIKGDKVLRHDKPARISHWTHAIGTTVLLISGIILGTRFSPSFVTDSASAATWFNVHFVFVLVFLFGTFYWLGNTLISRYRFKEHLPTKNAVKYTIEHYGHLLGMKKYSLPPEEKYFESERVAFVLALVACITVIFSGLLKVLAHVFMIPEGFMNVMTWVHDISAAAMLLFFVAHVFFAAIAPFSWTTLRSMFHGYIPLAHAKKEHGGWVKDLREEEESSEQTESSVKKDKNTSRVSGQKKGIGNV